MSTLAELRRTAMQWAREGWPETSIRDQLAGILEADSDLAAAALHEWSAKVAADVSAAAIQPAGRASRAPAVLDVLQQRMPWADLPAKVGYEQMHGYVQRFAGVAARRERYVRILAVLDPVWQAQQLDQCETFGAACAAAGVEAADLEALAAA